MSSKDSAELTDDEQAAIDDARDEFKAALKSGVPQSIEQHLATVNEELRRPLMRELLEAEWDYLRSQREEISLSAYVSRFPEAADLISELHQGVGDDATENEDASAGQALLETLDALGQDDALEQTVTFQVQDPGVTHDTPGRSAEAAKRKPSGPARVIAGYRITGELGKGGMGIVWRAVQSGTNREVALKLMNASAFNSEQGRFRFQQEAELAAMLEHPNIAQVYDAGIDADTHYYAMQLIKGSDLNQYVKEAKPDERQIVRLMLQICRAVEAAHRRGVIHRDLKPGNVAVTPDGHPYVLDFGLAKSLQQGPVDANATQDGQTIGTPAYMPPEQARGDSKSVDTRSDVYALGVILFRLVTGDMPHDQSGTTFDLLQRIVSADVRRPRDVNPEVNDEIESILLKALSKAPEDRYGGAGALADDLERYLDGEPVDARPATAMYFLSKRVRKYRVPLTIASSIVLALVSLVAYGYVRERGLRTKADRARAEAVANESRAKSSEERARIAEGEARDAEKAAKNEAETTRRQLYANRIVLAEQLRQQGDLQSARASLTQCPSDLRHLEWEVLSVKCRRQVTTLTPSEEVTCFAVTDDGTTVAMGLESGLIQFRSGGNKTLELNAHGGSILAMDYDAASTLLITFGRDNFVKVWDTESLEPVYSKSVLPVAPEGWANYQDDVPIAISHDGSRIAFAEDGSTAVIVDLDDELAATRLVGHENKISSISISPDNRHVATASFDRSVIIWDLSTGDQRYRLDVHAVPRPSFRWVAEFAGNETLVTISDFVETWDVSTGQRTRRYRPDLPKHMRDLFVSADGSRFATRDRENFVRIIDSRSGNTEHLFPSVGQFAISRNGRTFASTDPTGSSVREIGAEPNGRIIEGELLDLEQTRSVGLRVENGGTSLFKFDQAQNDVIARNQTKNIGAAAISQDGNVIAVHTNKDTVEIWDGRFANLNHRFPLDYYKPGLTLSPSGHRIVTTTRGNSHTQVWSLDTEQPAVVFETGQLTEAQFSPDGKYLVTCDRFGNGPKVSVLRDPATCDAIRELQTGEQRLTNFAFSWDSKWVAAAIDWQIGVWECSTGRLLQQLPGHKAPIRSLAFSKDGERLVSVGEDERLRFWDVDSSAEIAAIVTSSSTPSSVHVMPSSKAIVTGYSDRLEILGELRECVGPNTPIDLLALVDLKRDRVFGEWKRDDKTLVGKSKKVGAVYLPVEPRGSYRLTVRFVHTAGEGDVGICLAAPSPAQIFAVDAFRHEGYLHSFLHDLDEIRNLPDSQRGRLLTNGKEYELVATVEINQSTTTVHIDFDGERINTWTGKSNDTTRHLFQLPEPNRLGLRLWDGTAEFRHAELEMLTGYAAIGVPGEVK